eukprot:1207957-Pleurochrysis_carterae.AAC.3
MLHTTIHHQGEEGDGVTAFLLSGLLGDLLQAFLVEHAHGCGPSLAHVYARVVTHAPLHWRYTWGHQAWNCVGVKRCQHCPAQFLDMLQGLL